MSVITRPSPRLREIAVDDEVVRRGDLGGGGGGLPSIPDVWMEGTSGRTAAMLIAADGAAATVVPWRSDPGPDRSW